jgi:hypothetical protein
MDVFNDDDFWVEEIGFKKPRIDGTGKKRLIKISKGAKSLEED